MKLDIPLLLLVLLGSLVCITTASGAPDAGPRPSATVSPLPGVMDPALMPIGYSGHETFDYDISWTGGIKVGELHLGVTAIPGVADGYEIRAFVTTKNGALDFIYPVEDLHITRVKGPERLPYYYEVWQKEGYRYQAHRVFEFDQSKGYIRFVKNGRLEGEYHVAGKTNNEFSSFFNTRLMVIDIGGSFLVPTFADKHRVNVLVRAVARKKFEHTLFGPVSTVEIMPVITFRGLYDKRGKTVIWYTDDVCRIPIRVQSEIVIGSLTAELKAYDNPACQIYPPVSR